jgi:hypothetical protein
MAGPTEPFSGSQVAFPARLAGQESRLLRAGRNGYQNVHVQLKPWLVTNTPKMPGVSTRVVESAGASRLLQDINPVPRANWLRQLQTNR